MTWNRRDKLRLACDVGLLAVGLVLVAADAFAEWRASRRQPPIPIPPDMRGPTVYDGVL